MIRILSVSWRWMLAGAGVLLTYAPPGAAEDLPKQGEFAVPYSAAETLTHTIDLGDGTKVVANDARLLATNGAGQGIFHNTTAECVGVRGATRETVSVFSPTLKFRPTRVGP